MGRGKQDELHSSHPIRADARESETTRRSLTVAPFGVIQVGSALGDHPSGIQGGLSCRYGKGAATAATP
jgi:hypothetical protein